MYGKVAKATEVKANLLQFSGLVYANEATDKPKIVAKLAKFSMAQMKNCMDLCAVIHVKHKLHLPIATHLPAFHEGGQIC
jgi:hypothetical protein